MIETSDSSQHEERQLQPPTLAVPKAPPGSPPELMPYAKVDLVDGHGLDFKMLTGALVSAKMVKESPPTWSQIFPGLGAAASARPFQYWEGSELWVAIQESDEPDTATLLVGLKPHISGTHRGLQEVARAVPKFVSSLGKNYKSQRKRWSIKWNAELWIGTSALSIKQTKLSFFKELRHQIWEFENVEKAAAVFAAAMVFLAHGNHYSPTYIARSLAAVILTLIVMAVWKAISLVRSLSWRLEGWDSND